MTMARRILSVLLVVAACLACASSLELRVTQSFGSVHDVEKGVLRRTDGSWRFEAAKLSADVEAELAKAQPRDTLVTVRVALPTASGERVFLSSAPLCALKASDFADSLIVHLDESNQPFHLSYTVRSSDCETGAADNKAIRLNTSVVVRRTVDGPATTEAARPRPGEDDKTKGSTPFWMSPTFLMGIFAIVFLLPMLGGGAPQEGPGGPAAGGSARAPSARR